MCKCMSRGGSLKALDWKYRCSSHLAVRFDGSGFICMHIV
jgi:hypothetical protein